MIRNMLQFVSAVLVVIALVALSGCGGSKAPDSKLPVGHSEGDGHDHSKDKGDHSGHAHEKEGDHN
jgi:hypothetical protein